MTTHLAWKNISRNKTRSFIFIGAALLGLALAVFTINLMKGIADQRLIDAISIQTGHLQIQQRDYYTYMQLDQYITESQQMVEELEQHSQIKAITQRIVIEAVLTTPENTIIAHIRGVEPEIEGKFSALDDFILSGTFLESRLSNSILISKRTAQRLNLKLKSKVIVTINNSSGNIVGGAFRVSGIFETPDAAYDESNILVSYDDLKELSGIQNPHELAILLKDPSQLENVKNVITDSLPKHYVIYTWYRLLPELFAFNGFTQIVSILFTVLIILGLGFSLFNIMNMIIQERTQEIGMLRAIGQSKFSVFIMLAKESFFLMSTGSLTGILLGAIIVFIVSHIGVPLGAGLADLGIRDTIYPDISWSMILMVVLTASILSLIISIIPAIRTLRIKPQSALRNL